MPGEDTGRMMRQSRLLAALGRVPEAIQIDRRATELEPLAGWAWGMLGYHSAVAGRLDDARAALESLQSLIAKFADTGAYQIAQVYAWQGDRDKAFAWLDRANAQRDAGMIYLKFDPLMAKLRDDPRYTRWLERMRLPPG